MKNIKYIIPNGITLLNLLAGSFACVYSFEDTTGLIPVYLILAAAFFDLLDGLMAKIFKATSEFGKQLDSLADVISFGLAPSFIMYQILIMVFVERGNSNFLIEESNLGERLMLFSSFTIAVFAALRLARFNISSTNDEDFKGLPVPACALFIVSIRLILHITDNELIQSIILNLYVDLSIIAILSFLMVSNIRMISLKFKNFNFGENVWRYLLIAGILILYVVFSLSSLFFIMIYYIVLSLIKAIFARKTE
jgi:CDP-diacylglycerol---serine O-phosphatidyltransferase